MQGYDVYGNPEELRTQTASRKSTEGYAEYERSLQAQGATSFNMADPQGINIYGLFKYVGDIKALSVDVANHEVQQKLSPAARIALFVAAEKMFSRNGPIHPAIHEEITRTLTTADFDDFYRRGKDRIIEDARDLVFDSAQAVGREFLVSPQEVEAMEVERIERPIYFADHHLSAAHEAADALLAFLEGYGEIFKGDNDLYEVLSQPVVGLDWEVLDTDYPGASEIIEAAIMRAEASAITYARQKTGGLDLTKIVAHGVWRDEEGDPSNSLIHMQAKATKVNKLRAYQQAVYEAFQYDIQNTMAGEANSPHRKAATEIELGTTGRIFFRQPDDDDVLHRIAQTKLPMPYVDLLPKLEVGQAVMHIKDMTPLVFYYHVLPSEAALIRTRQAYEMMNQLNTNRHVAYLAEMSRGQQPLQVGIGQSEFG